MDLLPRPGCGPTITLAKVGSFSSQVAAGTYGKVLDGFEVTDLLADPKAHRGIRRNGEHDIGRVVSKGAAVPFGEAEHGRRADLVGEDVGEEPVRAFFPIGTWV